jgi:hypothetical protein
MRKMRSDAGVVRKAAYRKLKVTRRRVRCRCSRKSCAARRTLAKHPSRYVRPPRCFCGALLRPDYYRQLTETRKHKCECGHVHYPHHSNTHRSRR